MIGLLVHFGGKNCISALYTYFDGKFLVVIKIKSGRRGKRICMTMSHRPTGT